jgi:hypothetical protein
MEILPSETLLNTNFRTMEKLKLWLTPQHCFTLSSVIHVGKCAHDLAAVTSGSCFVLRYRLLGSVLFHDGVYLEQCVSLHDMWKQFCKKVLAKCQCKFHDERISSTKAIHNVLNKLRSLGLLTDKKQKCKRCLLRTITWQRCHTWTYTYKINKNI